MLGFFIFKFIATSRDFMILAALGMVIQIGQIAYKQVNSKFDFYFNIIFVNCRLLILVVLPHQLYYRGCPLNAEEFEPYVIQSLGLVGLLTILLLALRYQSVHGGRALLPSFILPAKYDYFVKFDPSKVALELTGAPSTEVGLPHQTVDAGTHSDEQNCPICLESIFAETSEHLLEHIKASPYFRMLGNRRHEYMKAPCDHRFHTVCLINWMQFKLECPSCRQPLPSV